MNVNKGFEVRVLAYHKHVVPKHTKIFDDEVKANAYKDILTKEVIWNTAVTIKVSEVYYVFDQEKKYLLSGDFVNIE